MLDDIDGVKSIRKYPYNSQAGFHSTAEDGTAWQELKLQFLSANGWLGCPASICDLRTCPNGDNYICDWACKNQPYLHKLHMFKKGYISSSLCMINDFCSLHIISYEILNKS